VLVPGSQREESSISGWSATHPSHSLSRSARSSRCLLRHRPDPLGKVLDPGRKGRLGNGGGRAHRDPSYPSSKPAGGSGWTLAQPRPYQEDHRAVGAEQLRVWLEVRSTSIANVYEVGCWCATALVLQKPDSDAPEQAARVFESERRWKTREMAQERPVALLEARWQKKDSVIAEVSGGYVTPKSQLGAHPGGEASYPGTSARVAPTGSSTIAYA